jgi:hypothetical protein
VADYDHAAELGRAGHELLGVGGSRGDRLLDDDVPAGPQRLQDMVEVHLRRRGDMDGLHLVVLEQALQRAVSPGRAGRWPEPLQVGVGDRHHRHLVVAEGGTEHGGARGAEPDDA